MPLKVYYGWARLNKIRKQPALSVIFENEENYTERAEASLRKYQHTCYTRHQTPAEATDGKLSNRMFTEFSWHIFQKPFNGNIELLLSQNYKADSNNLPAQQLEEIRTALAKGLKKAYPELKLGSLPAQLQLFNQ